MVKKLYFILQFLLFLSFNFSLLLTGYLFVGDKSVMVRPDYATPQYNQKEDFDPSLRRLNSLNSLMAYCDSVYEEKLYSGLPVVFEEIYPEITSEAVRNRFYHGYSMYGFSNNFMAMLLSKVSVRGLGAIVVPDDILKYPFAACSQQSIVMMEILKRKGFSTRVVGFQGKTCGHFCFEAYYKGSWHFYDPDMEPDVKLLQAYNRPGIDFLVKHRDLLLRAYSQYSPELVNDLFPTYFYERPNVFPAPNALIFQKVSKYLSYTIWLFFLAAFIWARKKYVRISRHGVKKKARRATPVQEPIPAGYFPEYSV